MNLHCRSSRRILGVTFLLSACTAFRSGPPVSQRALQPAGPSATGERQRPDAPAPTQRETDTSGAPAQALMLDLHDPRWEMRGAYARVERYLRRTALRLGTGQAVRRDVRFQDGTIEFDMATTTHRAFGFVDLRMASDSAYEEVYFRTHKSELPDAIQYAPVWHGVGNWQLYHGPGYTAAAIFPRNRWIHVRIVVRGDRAAVFVGDVSTPQLVVPHLARPVASGYIAFRGLLPGGAVPAQPPTWSISNVVVRPGTADFDFPAVPPAQEDSGVVRSWQVSPVFVPDSGAVRTLPTAILASPAWTTLPTDPSGLLVLSRWRAAPTGVRRPGVLARVTVHSDRGSTHRLELGYSDAVTVFLNGRPIFSGDAHYSFDNPRQEGLIGFGQATLYLPLREGDNELVLAVSDAFGGWGLMARFEDPAGLRVSPR